MAPLSVLVFDNGLRRPDGAFSSVDELLLPLDAAGHFVLEGERFGPPDVTWCHRSDPATDFYAQNLSSAQRLPNSNTLICDGPAGRVFEVTSCWGDHLVLRRARLWYLARGYVRLSCTPDRGGPPRDPPSCAGLARAPRAVNGHAGSPIGD